MHGGALERAHDLQHRFEELSIAGIHRSLACPLGFLGNSAAVCRREKASHYDQKSAPGNDSNEGIDAMGSVIVGAVILWVVPIFVAISQGRAKNRHGLGYGLLLGWVGVLVLAVLSPRADERYGECPHCREDIRLDASVCPHCRREVEPMIVDG